MRKIIVLVLIPCILFIGCNVFYNLNSFILPNDDEFDQAILKQNIPRKICLYMQENFDFMLHILNYSPYQMWLENVKNKVGDCNDYSTYAVFVADYHGYETYQICMFFKGGFFWGHALAVYVENGRYTYSSNDIYHPIYADDFSEVVSHYIEHSGLELSFYRVYNFQMKIIERGDDFNH